LKFRKYQSEIIQSGLSIIKTYGFLYLAMEVRTGKTITALGIYDQLGLESILFVTKKKAIGSIVDDYNKLKPAFKLEVINYESLHKVEGEFDGVVFDEAHNMAKFPKPSKRAKQAKLIVKKNNPFIILMSGTPTPESYSQMYHQVYMCPNNPFNSFTNFYKFSKIYVDVFEKRINSLVIRDYTRGKDSIIKSMQPYTVAYSQKEAGFKVKTTEQVIHVDMKPLTYQLTKTLKDKRVIKGKDEVVLADTAVKLMSKLHQLFSGTVKFEEGNTQVIDTSKAEAIRNKFKNMKIGIFYKFKAELDALKCVYGDDLTTTLDEFNSTDKNIALQIVSGREGISLKLADCLVYYNIDFSATSYWQSRDRMTTKDRLENKVYWIFSKGGIEDKIYKAVTKKKDYTLRHFKKDLLSL
tara:strand:- start:2185 stop:3411 length:1227 start_codon:yes stop_codon:yes gene_type:complete